MAEWTLGLLSDHVASKLQLKKTGAYSTDQIPKDVNRAYAYAYRFHPWNCLIQSGSTAIAVGDTQLVLPKHFDSLLQTFNTAEEAQSFEGYLPRHDSNITNKYQFPMEVPCIRQPSAAGLLGVKSSSGTDTSLEVFIEGLLSNEPQSETITSNGTTLVESTLQYDRIDSVSKGKTNATAGYFTVSNAAGTTTYSVISAWEARPSYTAYKLAATATEAGTIYFVGKRRFKPMLNKLSTPFMDAIAYALIDGAVALANEEFAQQSSEDILSQTMAATLNDIIAKTESSPMGRKIVRG